MLILMLCEPTRQGFYTGEDDRFFVAKPDIKRFLPKRKTIRKKTVKRKFVKKKRMEFSTSCFEDEVANFQGCVDNLVNVFKRLSGGQAEAESRIKQLERELGRQREINRDLARENKGLKGELVNIEVRVKESFKKREARLIASNEKLKADLDGCVTEFQNFKLEIRRREEKRKSHAEAHRRKEKLISSKPRGYGHGRRYRRPTGDDDVVLGMVAPE